MGHGSPALRVLAVLTMLVAPATSAAPQGAPAGGPPSFALFESGPVRPVALSPNGQTLFVCNIPDNRLEIFRVTRRGLRHRGSVPVGLEPVAVAARTNKEAWVVNHLSDSVSIVELRNGEDPWGDDDGHPVGRVARTLLVGDEPRDIVFAGRHGDRAFITTAHRGQNVPYDPQMTTPGIGRADVWVFDAHRTGAPLGGTPIAILTLFTDTPRALAASPDGRFVYAAGFHTGNRTTALSESMVTRSGLGTPLPRTNFQGIPQPPTGLIVKHQNGQWLDSAGRNWNPYVKFNLPDKDVFLIDATANPPSELGSFAQVGTVLFNMAVNPVNGNLYVSNTDARNDVRFEGAGNFIAPLGLKTVRGHVAENRITVIGTGGVQPRHLNKHIDFNAPIPALPNDTNRRSLAFPLDLAVSGDGSTLYVAAFGSSKIGVYSTAQLEADTFTPNEADQIPVTGGGPCGIALDERRDRLYVLTRFDNSISIIDTAARTEIAHLPLFNPEPSSVVEGRRFLYDASLTSGRGDTACASCHIFGDFDSLSWDLGDPDGTVLLNGGLFELTPAEFGFPQVPIHFLPNKGPMTTQSLRGLANHGSMHWRGDRQDNLTPSAQPDAGAFNEQAAFKAFNVAFVGLNGRTEPLTAAQMQAFTDFTLQILYPPNPVRNLDDRLTPTQAAGRTTYFNGKTDATNTCNECHVLDRSGNLGSTPLPGFFGTDGRFSFELEPQVFKIPHLRNMYQKVGRFGMANSTAFVSDASDLTTPNAHQGDQVRGFGYLHDGAVDTLFRFHGALVFMQRPPSTLFPLDPGNPGGFPPDGPAGVGQQKRRELESFLLAFDTNLKPIVGQQVTLEGRPGAAVAARLALMEAQAEAVDSATGFAHCDLVARSGGRGYLYLGRGLWKTDRAGRPPIPTALLRALARLPEGEVTFTCVPPGTGLRIGLDRDADGILDGDE